LGDLNQLVDQFLVHDNPPNAGDRHDLLGEATAAQFA
jgi:hypothetical protein